MPLDGAENEGDLFGQQSVKNCPRKACTSTLGTSNFRHLCIYGRASVSDLVHKTRFSGLK
jgi:hypothetical protein